MQGKLQCKTWCSKFKRIGDGIQTNAIADDGYTFDFYFCNKPVQKSGLTKVWAQCMQDYSTCLRTSRKRITPSTWIIYSTPWCSLFGSKLPNKGDDAGCPMQVGLRGTSLCTAGGADWKESWRCLWDCQGGSSKRWSPCHCCFCLWPKTLLHDLYCCKRYYMVHCIEEDLQSSTEREHHFQFPLICYQSRLQQPNEQQQHCQSALSHLPLDEVLLQPEMVVGNSVVGVRSFHCELVFDVQAVSWDLQPHFRILALQL